MTGEVEEWVPAPWDHDGSGGPVRVSGLVTGLVATVIASVTAFLVLLLGGLLGSWLWGGVGSVVVMGCYTGWAVCTMSLLLNRVAGR